MLTPQSLFAQSQITEIQKKYNKIWVAISGGVDSLVLLHLVKLAFANIHAIHINHNIDKEDSLAQDFCEKTCAQLRIPLRSITVDLSAYPGQGFEAAARHARRKAWQQTLDANDVLMLAHHADDQAETILYRLLRGSGPQGLSGMQPIATLGHITLMRPLLKLRKQELIAYAATHQLQWCEDTSNAKNTLDRNFLRNEIIPRLVTRWPGAIHNINRSGANCQHLLQVLKPSIEAQLSACVNNNDELELTALQQYDPYWQQELLRTWLARNGIAASLQHLNTIFATIIPARIDASPELKISDKTIRRHKHRLIITDSASMDAPEFIMQWNVADPLMLPSGKQLQAKDVFGNIDYVTKIAQHNVTVRVGKIGRKAKKIFQEHNVAPWLRHNYPLVFADDRLISIVGLWTSPRF